MFKIFLKNILSMTFGRYTIYASGRIVSFDPIQLSVLQRPRIDVLCSLSGIFRDSFSNLLGEYDKCVDDDDDDDDDL